MVEKRITVSNVEESSEKRSKYNNKKVLLTDSGAILKPEHIKQIRGTGMVPAGESFDSELEAEYYRDMLLPRVLAGEIEVVRQPKFRIMPGFTKNGVTYKDRFYIPDFVVTYADGRQEAIDVKGFADAVFLMKKMLFDGAYPDIPLLILKRVRKFGGWITAEEYAAHKKRERKEYRSLGTRTAGRKRK